MDVVLHLLQFFASHAGDALDSVVIEPPRIWRTEIALPARRGIDAGRAVDFKDLQGVFDAPCA